MIPRDSKNLPPYKLTPQYLSRGVVSLEVGRSGP